MDASEIKIIPIADLKPAEYNPRTITDDELDGLVESIRAYGIVDPIIVNKDMTVIGGHQRLKAATRLGKKNAPCVVLDLDKHDEKKLNILLNSQAISGNYDEVKLDEILQELKLDDNYEKLRLNVLEPVNLHESDDMDEGDYGKDEFVSVMMTISDWQQVKNELTDLLTNAGIHYNIRGLGE